LFGEDGKVCGVKKGDEIAKCGMVICDPTYILKVGLKEKLVQVG